MEEEPRFLRVWCLQDMMSRTGKNDFGLWRLKMHALLFHQGSEEALFGGKIMSSSPYDKDKKDICNKAHSVLILSLGGKVLKGFLEKSAAAFWTKLEHTHMIKSLSNRLHLKQRLYTFKILHVKHLEDHLDDFNKVKISKSRLKIKIKVYCY